MSHTLTTLSDCGVAGRRIVDAAGLHVLLRMVAALPELNQMSLQMRSLLTRQLTVGMAPLQELGLTLSPEAAMSLIDPRQFLGLITRMLSHVSSFFSSALVVFLTLIFMLI